MRAAALSYTSLLALIPLLAVAISVTSSLLKSEGEEKIYSAIDKFVSDIMPPAVSNTNAASVSLNPESMPLVAMIPTNSETAGTATNSVVETNRWWPPPAPKIAWPTRKRRRPGAFAISSRKPAAARSAWPGRCLLIFVVFALLGRIEETMNDVWGVTRSRNWLTRIEHYWFAVGLVPTLLVAGLILATGPRFARRAALRRIHAAGERHDF